MMLIYLLYYAFMVAIAFAVKGGKSQIRTRMPREVFDKKLREKNSSSRNHIIMCVIIIISTLVPIIDSFLGTVTVRSDSDYGQYEQVSSILQLNYSSGWGIFFQIVSYSLLIAMLIWIITNLNYRTENRRYLETLVDNYDKYQEVLANQKAKKEEKDRNDLHSLSERYGAPERIISIQSNSIEDALIVFPDTQNLYCNKQLIPFDQIIGCEVKDDSYTSVEGQKRTVTTTSTGSTIGRSVVGGLVAGAAGAIIGGTTAKKETEIIDNTKTITHHHYYAIIRIANVLNPIITIDCGRGSAKLAEEIKAIIDGIVLKRSQSHSKKMSVTDELLKLADLKERGILSEAEFEQQKQRILTNY